MLNVCRGMTLSLAHQETEMIRQIQNIENIELYIWILLLFISIFLIAVIVRYKVYRPILQWITTILVGLRDAIQKRKKVKPIDYETLDEIIDDVGYSYDLEQDIFYSNIDAWQRDMGYCRLYDEAAAPLGMIIDCEPIYFSYGGKRWLIEFWKGQYDLTTGGEVGVYTTTGPNLNIPDFFYGTFYNCAADEDLLTMGFTLKKHGKMLFSRYDKHWWVTGFKVGEFSEPWELTMDVFIALKDREMRDAFIKGLRDAGYSNDEIMVKGNQISLVFDRPHTSQPISRTEVTDRIIQRKNEILCEEYLEITGPYGNFLDKINVINRKAPVLYNLILNMGKPNSLFSSYEKIKDFLD